MDFYYDRVKVNILIRCCFLGIYLGNAALRNGRMKILVIRNGGIGLGILKTESW